MKFTTSCELVSFRNSTRDDTLSNAHLFFTVKTTVYITVSMYFVLIIFSSDRFLSAAFCNMMITDPPLVTFVDTYFSTDLQCVLDFLCFRSILIGRELSDFTPSTKCPISQSNSSQSMQQYPLLQH